MKAQPKPLSDFALRLRELLAEIEQHPKGSWERELAEQKLAQEGEAGGGVVSELKPGTPEWRAHHGIPRLPQCPRCGTTPPEIVMGTNGPECADCGSQSTELFLWPEEPEEPR